MRRLSIFGLVGAAVAAVAVGAGALAEPHVAAAAAIGLLRPFRRAVTVGPPRGCEVATLSGAGVTLRGWRCGTHQPRRGTIVFLHGVADNRTSATGTIERYLPRGFDVVAYDSRAHGESTGEYCTYGYYERQDLGRVIDAIPDGPVILIGGSLGAATALQATPNNPRVRAVIAAECFSDLRTVAVERAPRFLRSGVIRRAFALAEAHARFQVDAVSPVAAARRIEIPVLLIHGAADVDTVPEHSRRIFDALHGPKRFVLVEGAGHSQSLNESSWHAADVWIDAALPGAQGAR